MMQETVKKVSSAPSDEDEDRRVRKSRRRKGHRHRQIAEPREDIKFEGLWQKLTFF